MSETKQAVRRTGAARAKAGRSIPFPSLRSAAIGAAILAVAALAYLGALETSVFAVNVIHVAGGSPRVKAEVRRALRPELGQSLLRLDEGALTRRVEALPDVISVSFDRSFPNTLDVKVRAERAVLLLREGKASWAVSALGRVMSKVANPKRSRLPRLWLQKGVAVTVGENLTATEGKLAAAALSPLSADTFAGGVRTVISTGEQSLTLVLKSGVQVRLGGIGDLRLKLTIARKILHLAAQNAGTAPAYVDVSVPERPVMGVSQP